MKNNPTEQIRVACVGDSITELTEYTTYASQILGEKYAVSNFGVCGSKVSLDSDSPYMYSGAFDNAREFQPDIVLIMLGTNDADQSLERYLGNFVDDYLTLVERVQALASKPLVWIVKPPPIFNGTVGLSINVFDKEIIPAIEQAASRANLPLIDVYSALDSKGYFIDGVHPNEKGAKRIAEVLCKAIISK